MKKIFLALVLTVFGAFFGISAYADSSEEVSERITLQHMPVEEDADRQNWIDAVHYFDSCFINDEYCEHIYPDTFGGNYYKEEDNVFVVQVASPDLSEYLFLQEEFPCIELEQVKYSWEYMWSLCEKTYKELIGTEGVYSVGYDIRNNRIVVRVDAETLASKTNSSDSPIEYRLVGEWERHSSDPCIDNTDDESYEGLSATDASADESGDQNLSDSVAESNTAITHIYGGQTLVNRGKLGAKDKCGLTAGIGCKTYSGEDGLLICGHDMEVNDRIYLDGRYIGSVTFTNCKSGGIGDFGVVTLASGFVSDGSVYANSNLIRANHCSYNSKVGDKLFKYSDCKGFATFTVTATNKTIDTKVSGNVIKLAGMWECMYVSGEAGVGDSGCGVFHNSREDDYTSFLEFSGIIHGGNIKKDLLYFTPPQYINSGTVNTL